MSQGSFVFPGLTRDSRLSRISRLSRFSGTSRSFRLSRISGLSGILSFLEYLTLLDCFFLLMQRYENPYAVLSVYSRSVRVVCRMHGYLTYFSQYGIRFLFCQVS